MSQIDKVERFLRAQVAAHAPRPARPGPGGARPFVTISRQAGAGAHDLADTMVGVFDRQSDPSLFGQWQVFDRELCELVAADAPFSTWLDSLIDEEYPTRLESFFGQVFAPAANRDKVFGQVSRVVRAVATIGKAIIIGRGGSEVTRGMEHGIAIRLTAPQSGRIARIMGERGLGEADARRLMKRLDDHRARLVRDRFGAAIDDPGLYDLTFNSGTATFEEMSEAVAGMLQCRAGVKRIP